MAPPTFIESSFCSRADYDRWVEAGAKGGDIKKFATKPPEKLNLDPPDEDHPVPTPPPSYKIYSDDKSLGQACPDLSSLEYVKDSEVVVGNGSITVIAFWAKFAKGDYTTTNGLAEIYERFQRTVQFLGVSVDPNKADAEGFLKKLGQAMPEIYINDLKHPFPAAWDNGKVVKEAFRELTGLAALGASAVFVIDGEGKIVWREQFGQGYEPRKGQLAEQIRRLLTNTPLIDNGPAPAVSDDEDLDDMGAPDDYDSDLGF